MLKKTAVITLAGMSERFNQNEMESVLKGIYYEQDEKNTLLYRMVSYLDTFDKIILVGGYRFEELRQYVQQSMRVFKDRLILIENEYFANYGSGYSLYLGIMEAQKKWQDEIVFMEGDLYFDRESFLFLEGSQKDVVTMNREPITADRAVAFYTDKNQKLHYIYDTQHGNLEIKEPFLGIYHSAQIWKFVHTDQLFQIACSRPARGWNGTNLEIIQHYYGEKEPEQIELLMFEKWINCNTRQDYRRAFGL